MLLKGTKIGITGELTNRPYTAKDGTKRPGLECRVSDVTLLGKNESVSTQRQDSKQNKQDDFDESIPF